MTQESAKPPESPERSPEKTKVPKSFSASFAEAMKTLFEHAEHKDLGFICRALAFSIVLVGLGACLALVLHGWPRLMFSTMEERLLPVPPKGAPPLNWELNDLKTEVTLRRIGDDGIVVEEKVPVPEGAEPEPWAIKTFGEQCLLEPKETGTVSIFDEKAPGGGEDERPTLPPGP